MTPVRVVRPRVSYTDLQQAPEDGRRYVLEQIASDGDIARSAILPNLSFPAREFFGDW